MWRLRHLLGPVAWRWSLGLVLVELLGGWMCVGAWVGGRVRGCGAGMGGHGWAWVEVGIGSATISTNHPPRASPNAPPPHSASPQQFGPTTKA